MSEEQGTFGADKNGRFDAKSPTGQYWQNLLESCANWLETRSECIIISNTSWGGMMKLYAKELRLLRDQLKSLPNVQVNAERYVYVRESGEEFVHYTGGGTHGLYEGEELDTLVDASLAEQREREARRAAEDQ
jgi:hypothetical protein